MTLKTNHILAVDVTNQHGNESKCSPGSRRRQKGSDSSSSSEDECPNSAVNLKTKRSSHLPSAAQTQRHRTAGARSKSVSVETEEDADPSEVDPYQNWSTHSAEIAK